MLQQNTCKNTQGSIGVRSLPSNLEEIFSAQEELAKIEGSLYEFFKAAWPYIEGNMPYMDSWHIGAIAEHLEAVYARQIRKLIINVPPRTGKTNLISVAFPASGLGSF